MDNQDTVFPFTDLQIQRLVQIYNDLAGSLNNLSTVLLYSSESIPPDAALTNPRVIPSLVWHIARTMRKIEGTRERQQEKNQTTFGFDYVPPVVELRPKTWYLRVAECILVVLLLGTYNLYWRRLQGVRQYQSVNLRRFHAILGQFLTEWSGRSRVSVNTNIFIDHSLFRL